MNFFTELKRRNVYKVAVAYAVIGWLLVQVATQVFPFFEIPNWAVRLGVLAIVIGFPIALVSGAIVSSGLFFLGRYTVGNKTTPRLSEVATASSTPQKSIAVMPLLNESGGPEGEYFCAGSSEDV